MSTSRHHVVISGTGRAGTTFLVDLLTRLGLDTGFTGKDRERCLGGPARAGMEKDIRLDDCPYVVKSPEFCDYANEVVLRKDIIIDHVFIPMRDLAAAAESRLHVTETAQAQWSPLRRAVKKLRGREGAAGGLIRATDAEEQQLMLLERVYNLLLALSDTAIPVTLLRHPRIVKDADYLFLKLSPILKGISAEQFRVVFAETVRPDLVHSFTTNDR